MPSKTSQLAGDSAELISTSQGHFLFNQENEAFSQTSTHRSSGDWVCHLPVQYNPKYSLWPPFNSWIIDTSHYFLGFFETFSLLLLSKLLERFGCMKKY